MQPFNLTQAIIQSVLTILLTVMIGAIVFLSRIIAQRQPDHQIPNLEIFSCMATQCIEQEHGNAVDKKALAIGYCADLFRAFDLPVPPPEAISIAIASAMYKAQRPKNEEG